MVLKLSKKINFFFFLFVVTFSTYADAQDRLSVDKNHKGLIHLKELYTIFPENRINNAIYQSNHFYLTEKDLAIQDFFNLENGLLVYGKDKNNENKITLRSNSLQDLAFTKIGNSVVSLKSDKLRFYWIVQNKIEELVLPFKSKNGFVFHEKTGTLLFYHIQKTEFDKDQNQNNYFFKLHYINTVDKKIVTLKPIIKNSSSRITLKWISNDQIGYELTNGDINILKL